MTENNESQCDNCAHAWYKPSTRWEPEDGGCAMCDDGIMTEEEDRLSEIGKCPYFEECEKEPYISLEDYEG